MSWDSEKLRSLLDLLIEKDIAEFELERGDVKVRIRRAGAESHSPAPILAMPPVTVAAPAVPAPASAPRTAAESAPPASSAAPAEPAEEAGVHVIRSPIVGTFYESPSPGAPAFVKPGDTVAVGQVLCIIEAMKLMNEIEADISGEIVKCLVSNGQPIEFGQPLFSIRQH